MRTVRGCCCWLRSGGCGARPILAACACLLLLLLSCPACRLLFEVLPRALPMHLPPDSPMLVRAAPPQQQQQLQHRSGGGILGNILRGAAAVSARAHLPGSRGQRQLHGSRLSRRTLRRMVVVQQPVGREVRQRAALAAAARRLGGWVAVMLVGGAVGWLVRARREQEPTTAPAPAREQRQEQKEQQQRRRRRWPFGRRGGAAVQQPAYSAAVW